MVLVVVCIMLALGLLAMTALYVWERPSKIVATAPIPMTARTGHIDLYISQGDADDPGIIPNPLYHPSMKGYVGELWSSMTTPEEAYAARTVSSTAGLSAEVATAAVTPAFSDVHSGNVWVYRFSWEYAEHIQTQGDLLQFVRTGVREGTTSYPSATHDPANWGFAARNIVDSLGFATQLVTVVWGGSVLSPVDALVSDAGAFDETVWAWNGTFETGEPFVVDLVGTFSDTRGYITGVGDWDVSLVSRADRAFMNFNVRGNAGTSPSFATWAPGEVVSAKKMFWGTDFTAYDIAAWRPVHLESADYMFAFSAVAGTDFSGWFTTAGLKSMEGMFQSAIAFTGAGIAGWDVSEVCVFDGVFEGCAALAAGTNFSTWEVAQGRSFERMFLNCALFTGTGLDAWSLGGTAGTCYNIGHMFSGCAALAAGLDLTGWDVSGVVDMRGVFQGCVVFNGDISTWITSSVKHMDDMFMQALAFNGNITGWDTTAVVSMEGMFQDAQAFNQDISGWDVTSVTTMRWMFSGAVAFVGAWVGPPATSINIWQTDALQDTGRMFSGAVVFNTDLDNWNMSSVTAADGMFEGALAFNGNLAGWDLGACVTVAGMFSGTVGAPNTAFAGTGINTWWPSTTATYAVTDMSGMFAYCTTNFTTVDLGGWNVRSVRDFSNMFLGAANYTGVNISQWDFDTRSLAPPNNIDINMTGMFRNAASFVGAGIGHATNGWQTNNVTNMSHMFNGASTFNQPIGTWNVGRVVKFIGTFAAATDFNADLGPWRPVAADDMSHMFEGATDFVGTNLGDWGTSVANVKNFTFMFDSSGLTVVDLSAWTPTSATNMSFMFQGAANFVGTNLGGWDTDIANVENFGGMFSGATNFAADLSAWTPTAATDMHAMFNAATSFVGTNLGAWGDHVQNVEQFASMFAGATDFTGAPAAPGTATLGAWRPNSALSMNAMFEGANNVGFTGAGLANWRNNIGLCANFDNMFNNATNFRENISSWTERTARGASAIGTFTGSGIAATTASQFTPASAAPPATPIP